MFDKVVVIPFGLLVSMLIRLNTLFKKKNLKYQFFFTSTAYQSLCFKLCIFFAYIPSPDPCVTPQGYQMWCHLRLCLNVLTFILFPWPWKYNGCGLRLAPYCIDLQLLLWAFRDLCPYFLFQHTPWLRDKQVTASTPPVSCILLPVS